MLIYTWYTQTTHTHTHHLLNISSVSLKGRELWLLLKGRGDHVARRPYGVTWVRQGKATVRQFTLLTVSTDMFSQSKKKYTKKGALSHGSVHRDNSPQESDLIHLKAAACCIAQTCSIGVGFNLNIRFQFKNIRMFIFSFSRIWIYVYSFVLIILFISLYETWPRNYKLFHISEYFCCLYYFISPCLQFTCGCSRNQNC